MDEQTNLENYIQTLSKSEEINSDEFLNLKDRVYKNVILVNKKNLLFLLIPFALASFGFVLLISTGILNPSVELTKIDNSNAVNQANYDSNKDIDSTLNQLDIEMTSATSDYQSTSTYQTDLLTIKNI